MFKRSCERETVIFDASEWFERQSMSENWMKENAKKALWIAINAMFRGMKEIEQLLGMVLPYIRIESWLVRDDCSWAEEIVADLFYLSGADLFKNTDVKIVRLNFQVEIFH